MNTLYIGARVRDRVVGDCGTVVGIEGRSWLIEWDNPTPYLGRWNVDRGSSWFESLAAQQPTDAQPPKGTSAKNRADSGEELDR